MTAPATIVAGRALRMVESPPRSVDLDEIKRSPCRVFNHGSGRTRRGQAADNAEANCVRPFSRAHYDGALCDACFCDAANRSLLAGAIFGGLGAVAGAFGGYEMRRRLPHATKSKDFPIAVAEDFIALLAIFFVLPSTTWIRRKSSATTNGYHGHMIGVIVVVAYRPKQGKEAELLELVRSRVPISRKEGLVTDRAPILMSARDGTIIEVSEWKSPDAIEAPHKNPNVLAMWNRIFELCDCVPLQTVDEAREMFAGFTPIEP
jgi:quinol monooxygenase YgiN